MMGGRGDRGWHATEGVWVPDEIRERIARAIDAYEGIDGLGPDWIGIDEGGREPWLIADLVLAVLDRDALMAMLGAKQVGVLAHPGDRILDGPCPSPGCAHLAEAVYRIPSEDPQ